jgi:choloylglycine hydrolase
MRKIVIKLTLAVGMLSMVPSIDACTRVLHVTKDHKYTLTGRNMDWYVKYPTSFWKFPKGMKRDGLTKNNPLQWVSKYGSIAIVQTSQSQNAAADGMNEKGLVANLLYLTETKYPKRDTAKKGLATSIYLQYLLDNFATVKEAIKEIEKNSFQVVPVPIPNSQHLPTMHIALSDATGDSAVVEFIDGKTVIHHSDKYQIMANSPTFEKQLSLNAYWQEIGGNTFLPGTRKSADRFVRASFYNQMLPYPKNSRDAVAGVMSVMRNTSSPFGKSDPKKPNISSTRWRVIEDQKNLVLYYESTDAPNVIWVDLKQFDFSKGSGVKSLNADDFMLVGEVNKNFKKSSPLQFAKPTLTIHNP